MKQEKENKTIEEDIQGFHPDVNMKWTDKIFVCGTCKTLEVVGITYFDGEYQTDQCSECIHKLSKILKKKKSGR